MVFLIPLHRITAYLSCFFLYVIRSYIYSFASKEADNNNNNKNTDNNNKNNNNNNNLLEVHLSMGKMWDLGMSKFTFHSAFLSSNIQCFCYKLCGFKGRFHPACPPIQPPGLAYASACQGGRRSNVIVHRVLEFFSLSYFGFFC